MPRPDLAWGGWGFLAGVLGLLALPLLPSWGWVAFTALLVLMLAFKGWWPAAWIAGGFSWTLGYVLLCWHPLEAGLEGRDLVIHGRILNFPLRKPGGWRFDFQVEGRETRLPRKIRLSWYGGPEVKGGQEWQLTVRLKRPHGFRNPGGFDYERWLFSHGIGATGYVRQRGDNRLLTEAKGLTALRQRLAQGIDRGLADSSVRGIVKALALGSRDSITGSQWEVLRATGTVHLVAISGLHIGLVAGLLLALGRRLWLLVGIRRPDADQVGVLLACGGALGYAALAGFSLPTQRALLMLGAGLGAWSWRRSLSPWRGLGLALLGVCLWDPLAPLGAGFWLSFASVAWILYGVSGRLRAPGSLAAALRIQWFLMIGLAPLLVYFFRQVGWSAPLANLAAVPLVGFLLVPAILAGCAAWWIWPPAGDALWWVAAWGLEGLWRGLAGLARWGQGIWPWPPPSLTGMVLALAGMGLLLAPRGVPGRWLGGVMLLPLLLPPVARPPPGSLWLTVLDVGQGLAVVAETAGHVLVYDTGPRFSDRFDAGSDIIAPFLHSRGRRRLDLIVVSHGDGDHSGGLAGLWRRFPAPVFTSAPGEFPYPEVHSCREGQEWIWDGVGFRVLWPGAGFTGAANDRSCVLQIETAAGRVLLPGDLEEPGEGALLSRYGDALGAQVLVAPHHGSATSSSRAFLEKVRPRYVLVSSGYRNRFGFPRPRILARYRALGATVVNTASAGAIRVRIGSGIRVGGWRRIDRHLWSSIGESVPP